METCTNCGASLRPGAKFCTTCGTRLNESTSSSNAFAGWGNSQPENNDDSQQTSVLNAVQSPEEKAEEAPSIRTTRQRSSDSWGSAYSGGSSASEPSSNDPASRFISALDAEVKPTPPAEPVGDTAAADSGWGTPAFTPPAASNWSYSGSESTSEEKADTTSSDSGWGKPSTWATPAPETTEEEESTDDDNVIDAEFTEEVAAAEEPVVTEESHEEEPATDAAGFTDDGDDEVDYLSGDENIEVSGAENPVLPPDEARDRAISLVDELRRMVRMMGTGTPSDPGAAAMALTEASLNAGDYADLREVIAELQDDPRDIQALANLAQKADKIEALLDEHQSLVASIDRAITELSN